MVAGPAAGRRFSIVIWLAENFSDVGPWRGDAREIASVGPRPRAAGTMTLIGRVG